MELKKWTRKNLTEFDFKFAKSDDGKDWNCLASRLWKSKGREGKQLVVGMLDHELFRELRLKGCPACKRKPFLALKRNQKRIEQIFAGNTSKSPATEPLVQVSLCDAAKREEELRNYDKGVSVCALEIGRDEDSDVTLKRFEKWLVNFKKSPDSRRWVQPMKQGLAHRGALRFDAALRALAVRRLKEAGFKREEAEKALGLRRYALNPILQRMGTPQPGNTASQTGGNAWAKLPDSAKQRINAFAEAVAPLFG